MIQDWDVDRRSTKPDANLERRAKRYPTDLTDDEWQRIRPLLPKAPPRVCKPLVDLRTTLDAIRYMARSGGGWRMLPNDFPPWRQSTGGSGG